MCCSSPSALFERVLDQGVVERAKEEQPGEPGLPPHLHFEPMSKQHAAVVASNDPVAVDSMKPLRHGEAKVNPFTRFVRLDRVSNRAVASAAPDPERSIETHRGPAFPRPESVVCRAEGIQQSSPGGRRCMEGALMHVHHLHGIRPPGRRAPVRVRSTRVCADSYRSFRGGLLVESLEERNGRGIAYRGHELIVSTLRAPPASGAAR